MNKNTYIVFFFFALLISICTEASTYYVNSETGNDANNGKSESQPWKTLWKVNQHNFKPGDKILFASGTSYEGVLKPQGSGKKGKVIQINKYGEGANPAIHGKGWNEAALLLYNVSYWEVRNLEITNQGAKRKAKRRGVI